MYEQDLAADNHTEVDLKVIHNHSSPTINMDHKEQDRTTLLAKEISSQDHISLHKYQAHSRNNPHHNSNLLLAQDPINKVLLHSPKLSNPLFPSNLSSSNNNNSSSSSSHPHLNKVHLLPPLNNHLHSKALLHPQIILHLQLHHLCRVLLKDSILTVEGRQIMVLHHQIQGNLVDLTLLLVHHMEVQISQGMELHRLGQLQGQEPHHQQLAIPLVPMPRLTQVLIQRHHKPVTHKIRPLLKLAHLHHNQAVLRHTKHLHHSLILHTAVGQLLIQAIRAIKEDNHMVVISKELNTANQEGPPGNHTLHILLTQTRLADITRLHNLQDLLVMFLLVMLPKPLAHRIHKHLPHKPTAPHLILRLPPHKRMFHQLLGLRVGHRMVLHLQAVSINSMVVSLRKVTLHNPRALLKVLRQVATLLLSSIIGLQALSSHNSNLHQGAHNKDNIMRLVSKGISLLPSRLNPLTFAANTFLNKL
ncbi:hypothetical protein B566_EDAN005211 [Ephemera danica]|nr:hypothetical protein B566_EDAN005211 [Ephemera danica]